MEPPHPTATDIDVVDYDELVRRSADPSVAVVDVLPATTYQHGHIPGARNLPLASVDELADEVLPDKQQEIILYCASFT
jgi:rhodanese-related sulfurtransferase